MDYKEKAKAYDEAIERARIWKNKSGMPKDRQGILDDIFPELAESEDERIRKELLEHCKNQAKPYIYTGNKCPQIKSWIAWLEKQGQQDMIPLDKGIKFLDEQLVNDKDEVTGEPFINFQNYGAFKETFISFFKRKMFEKQGEKPQGKSALEAIKEEKVDNANKVEPKDYNGIDPHFGKPTDKVEPKFKVGDWVVDEENVYQIHNIGLKKYYECLRTNGTVHTFDFEYIDSKSHLWTIQDAKDGDVLYFNDSTIVIFKDLYNATTFHSYCHIEDSVFSISQDDMPDWWEGKRFVPATKEQRNLLFQKMKEAGYEWDAEKKELRKIEQKPVVITPKFKVGDIIHNKKEEYEVNTIKISEVKEDRYISGLCYLPFDKQDEWELVEQKPAWSEEDEKMLTTIVDYIISDNVLGSKYIDFLKSLKDRVQPKQEWSEEDVRNIQDIDSVLFYDKNLPEDTCMRLRNWLQSLRP